MPYGIYMHQVCDINKMFHQVGHQNKFFRNFAKLIKVAMGLKSFPKLDIKLTYFKNFENC